MGSSAQCNFRNVVGLGDVSKISFSSNNNGSREWLFGVHFPSVLKQLYSLDATFKVYEDASPISFAAFSKAITSFSLQVNSVDRRHSLELVAAFRDEIPKLPSNVSTTNSPPAVPSFSQLPIAFSSSLPTLYTLLPSTKSSISYSFTALDSRDSPSNPSKGSLLATKMELAFPPGSSQFAKIEGFIEKHTNLLSSPNTLVLSICSSVGAILGLKSQVNMSDRYFQGGGLFLRGWQMSGIGPRSSLSQETDGALGGTVRSNFLAAISAPFPFPFESSENLRTFAFLNLGTLLNYPIPSLSSQPWRLSTGCGFSYSMGPLRLEATYTFPLRYSPHDKLKPFQIGFGISMN